MKLNPIAANQTEIESPDGKTVLYSYKTPVAVFVPGQGAKITQTHYSSTTTRHINKALSRWGVSRTEHIPQTEIEALAN